MSKSIEEKKRVEIISMCKQKSPIKKIARKLKVCAKTVRNYVRKFQSTGSLAEKRDQAG